MKKNFSLQHEFVEFIPSERAERRLYVSIEYATAVHNCFCGCGSKIVTPISPTGWQFTFDGDSVSLHPSVGSWGLPCRSHYWIDRNTVVWAGDMSTEQIERGRHRDRLTREAYFGTTETTENLIQIQPEQVTRRSLLSRARELVRRFWH
ncbi:DUF6527 family protein [Rhizobium laguerreae]|uniref:DUF6527 family protein n=1 Tax=Rhizobium laguerreae TaxID=1076926 RepID=UPI001C91FCF2|nr:DUF6527 family protein [Rhizobium laguerreae]MBY3201334.1 hypothetical protein [Rhizobium laguerreae]